jgi:hypothetical protein
MQKFNPPSEAEYTEYLNDSSNAELYDRASNNLERIREKISDESDAIAIAKQFVPFCKRLQSIADDVVGKWTFLEPGTEVNFGDKMTKLHNPMILYGLSLDLWTRIYLPENNGFTKTLVGKDGKVVELSFNDMYYLDRIKFSAIMLTNKTARIIPAVIYDDYMFCSMGYKCEPSLTLPEMIDMTLEKEDRYNRVYHIIKDMTAGDAKEKCDEFLRANKDRILGTLGNDRENIIKGYDYITENIGTILFDGEKVMKLYGSYG